MRGLLGVCLNFKETLPPRAQASNLGPILLPILTLPIELENSFDPSFGSAYDEPRLVLHPLPFPKIPDLQHQLLSSLHLNLHTLDIHHSPHILPVAAWKLVAHCHHPIPSHIPCALLSDFSTDLVAITIGQLATSSTRPTQHPPPLLLSHVGFLG